MKQLPTVPQPPPSPDGPISQAPVAADDIPVAARMEAELSLRTTLAVGAMIGFAGGFLRVWQLNTLGFNSDEAVYAGQAASIAGNIALRPFFPIYRAHPLLFQTVLSFFYRSAVSDFSGRLMAVLFGMGTVFVTYHLGRLLYSRKVGLAASGILALMPYHVVVSRQVLLDVPMVFFATLSLYLLARFSESGRTLWLYATGGALGLTFLSKETSVILLGAVFAFVALAPHIRVRLLQLGLTTVIFILTVMPYPLSILFSGRSQTGQQFLAYQLFRRPNHGLTFYPIEVTRALGILVVLATLIGLIVFRHLFSWRETLLLVWVGVPVAFFEAYPIKGFQYLLPIVAPVAVLAARPLVERLPEPRGRGLQVAALALVLILLGASSWARVQPSESKKFLAGSGGVPGGRRAGAWVAGHVPRDAKMLALGPSMANIVEWYGRRKAYGLSVSPNPLRRNPVYEPVGNPDLLIRTNELQYLVWDSFSASRSPFFAQKLLRYAERYHGRIVHSETVASRTRSGAEAKIPVIVIYEVRP